MMADNTSYKLLQRIEARQRVGVDELEDETKLANTLDTENNWSAVCADDYVIEGCQVVHDSGRDFRINFGSVIVRGEILKNPSPGKLTGDRTAVSSGNDRWDIIYIDPEDPYVNTAAESATKTVMSAITMTSVSGEAVGTGDDTTKVFDLGNDNIDPSTLLVYVDGSQIHGGYDFSKGTGTAGVDQIIFADAPAAGLAITDDYDHLTGGVESSSSVNTRYQRTPKFQVWEGTESASPSLATEQSALIAYLAGLSPSRVPVQIGAINYGTSWSTGAPSSIDNTIKSYMVAFDNLGEDSSDDHTPNKTVAGSFAGRLVHPIRNMHQICEGFRLYWSSATEIGITPGWGVCRGVAFQSDALVTFSPTWGVDISAQQWYYVYAVVSPTNTTAPGSPPTILVSGTAPDRLRRLASDTGTFYLGAIYNDDGASVDIREYYTHGDWTYWADPSLTQFMSGITATSQSADIAITDWCPVTGRLVDVGMNATWTTTSPVLNEAMTLVMQSHKSSGSVYSYNSPDFLIRFTAQVTSSVALFDKRRGIVRAEQDGSTRKVSYDLTQGAGNSVSAFWWVNGYKDDYRTMGASGASVMTH